MAPTYDGRSTSTASPGSTSTRATRSSACWLPSVISTSGAALGICLAAAYSRTASTSPARPRVRMYWNEPAASRARTSA